MSTFDGPTNVTDSSALQPVFPS